MTAVLSAGYVSPAYKAASDAVIPLEGFIQHALGIRPPEESPAGKAPGMKPSAETLALLTRMGSGCLRPPARAPESPPTKSPKSTWSSRNFAPARTGSV